MKLSLTYSSRNIFQDFYFFTVYYPSLIAVSVEVPGLLQAVVMTSFRFFSKG